MDLSLLAMRVFTLLQTNTTVLQPNKLRLRGS